MIWSNCSDRFIYAKIQHSISKWRVPALLILLTRSIIRNEPVCLSWLVLIEIHIKYKAYLNYKMTSEVHPFGQG